MVNISASFLLYKSYKFNFPLQYLIALATLVLVLVLIIFVARRISLCFIVISIALSYVNARTQTKYYFNRTPLNCIAFVNIIHYFLSGPWLICYVVGMANGIDERILN